MASSQQGLQVLVQAFEIALSVAKKTKKKNEEGHIILVEWMHLYTYDN